MCLENSVRGVSPTVVALRVDDDAAPAFCPEIQIVEFNKSFKLNVNFPMNPNVRLLFDGRLFHDRLV